MRTALVNGYILVSPVNSEITYRGVDRAPWEMIDSDYYLGKLPPVLHTSYKSMKLENSRSLWWLTCNKLETVISFAEFEQQKNHNYELLAVWSPYLAGIQNHQGWKEPKATFLGIDIISVGEWSLLRAIQACQHPTCSKLKAVMNSAGLLSNKSYINIIVQKYRELANKDIVEPIAEPGSGIAIEAVNVYSLCKPSLAKSKG